MGLNFVPGNIGDSDITSNTLRSSHSKDTDEFSRFYRREQHGTVPLHFTSDGPPLSTTHTEHPRYSAYSSQRASTDSHSTFRSENETDLTRASYISSWLAALGGAVFRGDGPSQSHAVDMCSKQNATEREMFKSENRKPSVFAISCVIGGAVAVAVTAATLYNLYQQQDPEQRRQVQKQRSANKPKKRETKKRAKNNQQKKVNGESETKEQLISTNFELVHNFNTEDGIRADFDCCADAVENSQFGVPCSDDVMEITPSADPASTSHLGWQYLYRKETTPLK